MNFNLKDNIVRYLIIISILAGFFISYSNGQNVYREIDPPHIVESGQGFEIDFNEDSIVDLLLWKDNFKAGAGCIAVQAVSLFSMLPNDTAYMFYDSTGVLYVFNYLDTITESTTCLEEPYSCQNNSIYYCPFLISFTSHDCGDLPSTSTGLIKGIFNKYLGFRLKILDNYHYGWINFSKSQGVDFKLRAYAYNTIPEEVIVIEDPFYTSLETTQVTRLNCYPNPASDVLTIDNIDDNGTIEIMDLAGRIIFSEKYYNSPCTIPVNSLINGIYILQVSNANGRKIEKFVKE